MSDNEFKLKNKIVFGKKDSAGCYRHNADYALYCSVENLNNTNDEYNFCDIFMTEEQAKDLYEKLKICFDLKESKEYSGIIKYVCPHCGSKNIGQYRKMTGPMWCEDCSYSYPTKEKNNPFKIVV